MWGDHIAGARARGAHHDAESCTRNHPGAESRDVEPGSVSGEVGISM